MSEVSRPSEMTALPQLGRYQLLEQLGEDGMGQVYLAHDQRLDRRVAVKVLPPGSVNDPDAVARFQREAKALAQLSHPLLDEKARGENVRICNNLFLASKTTDMLATNQPRRPERAPPLSDRDCGALSGLRASSPGRVPRALPWAGQCHPFGVKKSQHLPRTESLTNRYTQPQTALVRFDDWPDEKRKPRKEAEQEVA